MRWSSGWHSGNTLHTQALDPNVGSPHALGPYMGSATLITITAFWNFLVSETNEQEPLVH